ncbi:MAG TPA: hypothetical protein DD409_09250 [Bacteroidales bacterium]|nr:hypothetical protein [Bacteroidales bacterium]
MYQTLQPLIGCCYRVDRKSVGLLYETISILTNIAFNTLQKNAFMNALFDVKDKVVILSGHQGRMGVSLADCLVQEGAIVLLLGSCPEEGRALVEAMILKGGEAAFFEVDPSDAFGLLQVQEDIMLEYGRIDALVYELEGLPNMTMASCSCGLLDVTPPTPCQSTNNWLENALLTIRTFLKPMLRQQEGSIVFLLDYPQTRRRVSECTHTQVLRDVTVLTKALAGELVQRFGSTYRVNTLMVGNDNPVQFNPENLQGTLHFLISEASLAMTGNIVLVDEGFHIFADNATLTTEFV